jgi:hypothetical protein
MTIDEALAQLRAEFPSLTFDGADRAEGVWIKIEHPPADLLWERNMVGGESAYNAARKAALALG